MSLGTNISRLRAETHLSQGDLAELLDVSRQQVGDGRQRPGPGQARQAEPGL